MFKLYDGRILDVQNQVDYRDRKYGSNNLS